MGSECDTGASSSGVYGLGLRATARGCMIGHSESIPNGLSKIARMLGGPILSLLLRGFWRVNDIYPVGVRDRYGQER